MKLAQLQEAKYKDASVLKRYEDAFDPIEDEPIQITPNVKFKFFDIDNIEGEIAGVFYFYVSAQTSSEICRKVKCPTCQAAISQPCKRMRGQIHKERYRAANRALDNDDFLEIQDVQHARGFVKHLLRKYNLPYTEIRINVSFAKSIYFAVFHPNLKERSPKWDGNELQEASLSIHPVVKMVNNLIKFLRQNPKKTIAGDAFEIKYINEAIQALTDEFGQPEIYGLTDEISKDRMWEWHHNAYSILLEYYHRNNDITVNVWISDTQHQDIADDVD